jgi:L-2,4-diaminobutyric acid acetyltransferase
MDHEQPLLFREPALSDAIAISQLVRRSPPLDVNSHYVSLLLCRDFYATCVVAQRRSAIVGFLSAYRLPGQGDTIFVWQVAVDSEVRSRGMASQMLDALLSRDACADVRYLEATITPSNESSQRLFRSLAKRHDTVCEVSDGFSADVFGAGGTHEPEELYRIGPFRQKHFHGEG